MSHIKSRDTSIELALRKALWNKGYRYRTDYKRLPGRPDIVLPRYRIAIFCDGEYFHGKDWEQLRVRLEKGKNSEFWIKKISDNMARDDRVNKSLRFLGWSVLRFWGRDIKKNPGQCISAIEEKVFDNLLGDSLIFDEMNE